MLGGAGTQLRRKGPNNEINLPTGLRLTNVCRIYFPHASAALTPSLDTGGSVPGLDWVEGWVAPPFKHFS